MIKLIRNANDTAGGSMIDLMTLGKFGHGFVWCTFHEDMLDDSNIGRPAVDGIKTAYETLHEANEVECVLLTVEEFKALTGPVPGMSMQIIPEVKALVDAARFVVEEARKEMVTIDCDCGACQRRARLAEALAALEAREERSK